MLLYNLLLYFSLGERSYLYYVLYIACPRRCAGNPVWLRQRISVAGTPTERSGAADVHQSHRCFHRAVQPAFSRTGNQWPAAEKVINGFIWLFVATAIGSLFLDYQLAIKTAIGASLIALARFVISARLWLGGYQPARYYLIAFAVLLLGFSRQRPDQLQSDAGQRTLDYGTPVGSMLEITLLSFALAHRLKLARDENEHLQRQHAAELEQRVASRTKALDQALHDLTQANEQLQRLTVHDALTGLKNRKFLTSTCSTPGARHCACNCRWVC